MKYCIVDIEADGLKPTKLHCAATLTNDGEKREWVFQGEAYQEFVDYLGSYPILVGHSILGFDLPVLNRLAVSHLDWRRCIDTLVVSQLVNFPREEGHSLESYGPEAGVLKEGLGIKDWDVYSPTMLDRCNSDVAITCFVLKKYWKYITSPRWKDAMRTEHDAAWYCNELHDNGFAFDKAGAVSLRGQIDHECKELEAEFAAIFPRISALDREIVPRVTKHGTLSRSNLRWAGPDLTEYSEGASFSRINWVDFNPGSTKQRIDRLWKAGWKPTEKTKGHREFLRSLPRAGKKFGKIELTKEQVEKKEHYEKYGWTCGEANLTTLPEAAPEGIKRLVRWLLLSSRVRRLDEWLGVFNETTGRIHGRFRSLGAWSHRMAHSEPNMGNVPTFNSKQPDTTPYSDVMRSLWIAERGKYLVGVDAESIQLRVLAHYLEDQEFTNAIVAGDKAKGTDPHSVNQRAIGVYCKSRDAAKTFIYAWLLGAGLAKVAEILRCTTREAREANDNFIARYPRLKWLKESRIPQDAINGWFEGFDGRAVRIPGNEGQRQHLALAGYLQNGEAIVMKRAMQIWNPKLRAEKIPFKLVNFVHDEWQVEVGKDLRLAQHVAETMADAIRQAGEDLHLKCPMAGSIMNSHGKLAIGLNWGETH